MVPTCSYPSPFPLPWTETTQTGHEQEVPNHPSSSMLTDGQIPLPSLIPFTYMSYTIKIDTGYLFSLVKSDSSFEPPKNTRLQHYSVNCIFFIRVPTYFRRKLFIFVLNEEKDKENDSPFYSYSQSKKLHRKLK